MEKFSKDDNVRRIVETVDIVEFIGRFVELKKQGNSYKGFSPFKEENTPSFSVKPSDRIFKDFSSGIAGNVIKFYQEYKKISFYESMQEIAKIYGITLNGSSIKYEDKLEHKILRESVQFFKDELKKSDKAKEYIKNRGYSLESLSKYYVGYAADSWNNLSEYLLNKYEADILLKLGLIAKSNTNDTYYDVFRDRIIFPIFNSEGKIIALGGRYIGDNKEMPKYINSPETEIYIKSNELYGIFDSGLELKKAKYAILTEGYLDVLSSHINGFEMTVASLGTAFTEKQAQLLKKYVNSIILLYDNDEAGKNASKIAINILNKYDFNIRCASLPSEFKDPDEYFRKHNKEDFLELLSKSKDSFEYIYDLEVSELNLSYTDSKKEAINRMKKYFMSIKSEISFNDYLEKFSKLINVDSRILKSEYRLYFNFNKKEINKGNDTQLKSLNIRDELEKSTLLTLLSMDKFSNTYFEILSSFEMKNEIYFELNKKLSSIGYNLENKVDMYLSDEEQEILMDLSINIKDKINDSNCLKLVKDWLNIMLKEIFESDNILKFSKFDRNLSENTLKNEIKNAVSKDSLKNLYDKILNLKGDYNVK